MQQSIKFYIRSQRCQNFLLSLGNKSLSLSRRFAENDKKYRLWRQRLMMFKAWQLYTLNLPAQWWAKDALFAYLWVDF